MRLIIDYGKAIRARKPSSERVCGEVRGCEDCSLGEYLLCERSASDSSLLESLDS